MPQFTGLKHGGVKSGVTSKGVGGVSHYHHVFSNHEPLRKGEDSSLPVQMMDPQGSTRMSLFTEPSAPITLSPQLGQPMLGGAGQSLDRAAAAATSVYLFSLIPSGSISDMAAA